MHEQTVVNSLVNAAIPLGLPIPEILIGKLPRHEEHRWGQRDVSGIKGKVWHQELAWGTVEGVNNFHIGEYSTLRKGGVESIPYTWAIRKNGQIILCNSFASKTWSQGTRNRIGDENAEFMSVMFEGMFPGPGFTHKDAAEPTQEQIMAGIVLWRICALEWGWDSDDLFGHYHFDKPACPGHTGQAIIEALRVCKYDKPPVEPTETVLNVTNLGMVNLSETTGRQRSLIHLGFLKGGADGIWGPMSKGALMAYEEAVGLEPDGVWDKVAEGRMVSSLANYETEG